MDDITVDLIRQVSRLQAQVDGLVKPEIALGLSLIDETILSGSVASVTFSNIPQGFRHLMVITEARDDVATETDNILMRINNDSTAIYDNIQLSGSGATATSDPFRAETSFRLGLIDGANSRANNFSPSWGVIFGYALSIEKSLLALSGSHGDASADADLNIRFRTGRYRSTTAVTSLVILPNSGNFVTTSRFQLYGIF